MLVVLAHHRRARAREHMRMNLVEIQHMALFLNHDGCSWPRSGGEAKKIMAGDLVQVCVVLGLLVPLPVVSVLFVAGFVCVLFFVFLDV